MIQKKNDNVPFHWDHSHQPEQDSILIERLSGHLRNLGYENEIIKEMRPETLRQSATSENDSRSDYDYMANTSGEQVVGGLKIIDKDIGQIDVMLGIYPTGQYKGKKPIMAPVYRYRYLVKAPEGFSDEDIRAAIKMHKGLFGRKINSVEWRNWPKGLNSWTMSSPNWIVIGFFPFLVFGLALLSGPSNFGDALISRGVGAILTLIGIGMIIGGPLYVRRRWAGLGVGMLASELNKEFRLEAALIARKAESLLVVPDVSIGSIAITGILPHDVEEFEDVENSNHWVFPTTDELEIYNTIASHIHQLTKTNSNTVDVNRR